MSTATEISRLSAARNTIRDKLVDLGLATSTAKLDALATAIYNIENKGAVSATVQEGSTYTIPAGYHNGSGTVSGIAGGGNYTLQSKSVTPTKSQQSVTPDSGYYGLSDVTVSAIPEAYQNVSSVTATAADVLSPKIIVNSSGETITGTMSNIGGVNATLDVRSGHTSMNIPQGYHNGNGIINIVTEEKSATPTTSSQNITPTSGKVLSKVTVAAIPSQYKDISNVTATASDVLSGKTIVTENGEVTGTIASKSSSDVTVVVNSSGLVATAPAGYYASAGTKTLTSLSIPKSTSFTVSTTANTSTDNSVLTVTNGTKRTTEVSNTGGTVSVSSNGGATNVTSNGSVTVTSPQYGTQGNDVTIIAWKPAASAQTSEQITRTLVEGGIWKLQYQDVSSVTATASDVLSGKKIVTSNGEVTGTMSNVGGMNATLDVRSGHTSIYIPQGYHNGSGTVSIVTEEKSATPTESAQNITPIDGKVLSKVTVGAISSTYVGSGIVRNSSSNITVSGVTVTAPAGYYESTGTKTLTSITVPRNTSFTVSTTANTSTDSSTITVTNGAKRNLSITNAGSVEVVSGAVSVISPQFGVQGNNVTITAWENAASQSSSQQTTYTLVQGGIWKHVMTENGAISGSINGISVTSYTIPAGYTSGGTVSLTSDIEDALAAI